MPFPFRAPFGAVFAAWADDTTFDGWVGSAIADIETFRAARAAVRARGFDVELPRRLDDELVELSRQLSGGGADPALLQYIVSRLVGEPSQLVTVGLDEVYDVSGIDAPVFATEGAEPEHVLSVTYRAAVPLQGNEIMRVGGRVRAVAHDLGRTLSP